MKKEILVIDYESSILQLLGFILSKDYNLVLKLNCYDALIWLEHRANPDLILMDLEMPCFDGKEFIKSLKVSGFYRSIPIIVLTDKEESSLSMDLSFNIIAGSIKKPFNPVLLKQKIGEILYRNHNGDELGNFYN